MLKTCNLFYCPTLQNLHGIQHIFRITISEVHFYSSACCQLFIELLIMFKLNVLTVRMICFKTS